MKVYAVCPGGVGTSLILKQNLITIFEELNIQADVDFMGGWELKNAQFDLCFVIGYVYENVIKSLDRDDPRRDSLVRIVGVMDMDEIREKAVQILKAKGYIK